MNERVRTACYNFEPAEYKFEEGARARMGNKTKHLEMIQGVINRLSTNFFLLKGWSIVLVSALFALSAADPNQAFVLLAYIPAFVFWGLDGYFLWEEKKYRRLYDRVRALEESEIDFSMDTTVIKDEVGRWEAAVISKTLWPFHGVLIVAIIIVMLLVGGEGG